MKKGVLLINLGTPDSPSTGDVRKYLTEFLNDPRVIDISPVGRFFLVNAAIVPFRAPKSAKLYKSIWSEKGSPLLFHTENLKSRLQKELGDGYAVSMGMRYQSPSISSALEELRKQKVSGITVVSLYPQYASSSTGSSVQEVMRIMSGWEVIPDVRFINKFYDQPSFIKSFASNTSKAEIDEYDHVLFSYHGLPERQILKASAHYGGNYCQLGKCCDKINQNNHYCYRASSFSTTRDIVKELGIPEGKYSVGFQSRLGRDPWIKPYSDYVIKDLAEKGIKKLLVFSPAFVADCLETIHEIAVEYEEIFKEHGGEKLTLVKSLNDSKEWTAALAGMIR